MPSNESATREASGSAWPLFHDEMTVLPQHRACGRVDQAMATRGGPRYRILGRATGPDRLYFAVWDKAEAKA